MGKRIPFNGVHAVGNGIGGFRLAGRILQQRGFVLVEQYTVFGAIGRIHFVYIDLREGGTAAERLPSNACHAGGQVRLCECGTIGERIGPDIVYAFGNVHCRKCVAAVERIASDAGHVVGRAFIFLTSTWVEVGLITVYFRFPTVNTGNS